MTNSSADPDDATKPPFYLANQGDVICLCNMDTAMLDLPIASPKALAERAWEANPDRIPPLNTKVDVIFASNAPAARARAPLGRAKLTWMARAALGLASVFAAPG